MSYDVHTHTHTQIKKNIGTYYTYIIVKSIYIHDFVRNLILGTHKMCVKIDNWQVVRNTNKKNKNKLCNR